MKPVKAKPTPAPRPSLGQTAGRKPTLTKQYSTPIFSRSGSGPMTPVASASPTIARYIVPPPKQPMTSITVRYRSCDYVFRPRPDEYYGLVERLKSVVIFTGDPVMTYQDKSGRLKYLTNYHEMLRAYSEYIDHLTLDLRFD